MAGPQRDPMMEIEAAKYRLKNAQMLQKHQLDMAQLQHQQQVDQFRAKAEMATKGQELQLKAAGEKIKAQQKAQQKAEAGKEKAEQRTQEQLDEPILNPPQQVDMMRPQPGMETMPQVGPSQLATIGGGQGSQLAPGGSPPPQQPPAQGQMPNLMAPPTKTTTMTTQAPMRTKHGFVPGNTTRVLVEPNVLSADEAARLQIGLIQARQKSEELWLDELAKIGQYAKTPGAKKAFQTQVLAAAQKDPSIIDKLEHRMGVLEADDWQLGTRNPKEYWDPKSPTGTSFQEGGIGAIGKPGLRLASAEAEGRAMGSALGKGLGAAMANLLPSPKTINNLQERQVNSANALARVRGIYNSWDPTYLQKPTQWYASALDVGEKFGMSVNPEDKAFAQQYSTFEQNMNENVSAVVYELTGKQINENEARRALKIVPNMGDGPTKGKAKLDNFYLKTMLSTVRNTFLLTNGIGSGDIARALQEAPELEMTWGAPGAADPGAERILDILDQAQTRAEMQLRERAAAEGVSVDDTRIKGLAIQNTAQEFGLSPEDVRWIFSQ